MASKRSKSEHFQSNMYSLMPWLSEKSPNAGQFLLVNRAIKLAYIVPELIHRADRADSSATAAIVYCRNVMCRRTPRMAQILAIGFNSYHASPAIP